MERNVETSIDEQLRNKKWIESISNPRRNVYKQEPKTKEQKRALEGTRPDYVLYEEDSNTPLIILEAKRQGRSLDQAMSQAIGYAKKIKAPIAMVTDGIFLKTYHLEKQKPLYLNKEEVDTILEYSIAIKFRRDNEVLTIAQEVIKSREQLISIFKDLNNKLSEAGVSAGIPRTEFFCNMLFLKVISEIAEQEDSLTLSVPKEYRWEKIKEKKGRDLYDFINKQALEHFKKAYGGEVLSPIKDMINYSVLDDIVKNLDTLSLASTNTDIKGDAFEYFLRNYGGADTDFGQYFTPRHIVKTLVKLLNPQFGEKIYDPFCGTGGMLIESFKYIYDRMPRNENTIKQLKESTIYGGELSEMSRIAKMNMILAGDGHSNIIRQDSYGSPQEGKYDVVITNIPFGKSRKTKHLGLYKYDGDSSELAGVLHCLDALSNSENARAGIIVPKSITLRKDNQFMKLREKILEQHELVSIISLSNSTFLPNAGISSDILILKKKKNISQKGIWHFSINNDGFSQDTSRIKLEGKNDIDILLENNNLSFDDVTLLKELKFTPLLLKDIKNKENNYSLDILKYIKKPEEITIYPLKTLKELNISIKKGKSITAITADTDGEIPVIGGGRSSPYKHNKSNYEGNIITVSASGAYSGFVWYHNNPIWASDCNVLQGNEKILTPYLYFCLKSIQDEIYKLQKGTGQPHVYKEDLEKIKIPVPPLEIQLEIQLENEKIEEAKKQIEEIENRIKNKIHKIWE